MQFLVLHVCVQRFVFISGFYESRGWLLYCMDLVIVGLASVTINVTREMRCLHYYYVADPALPLLLLQIYLHSPSFKLPF